jgi:hypothetical protein
VTPKEKHGQQNRERQVKGASRRKREKEKKKKKKDTDEAKDDHEPRTTW